jgi:hypothetical protein
MGLGACCIADFAGLCDGACPVCGAVDFWGAFHTLHRRT